MQTTSSASVPTVINRYPIRHDSAFSADYIDEDSDGTLATDELRTTEPVLSFDDFYDADELKVHAKEKGLGLMTPEQVGSVTLEGKEREYEDSEDYQYVTLESMDDFASGHRSKSGKPTTWAIDPLVGKPGELELLIVEK